MKIAFDVDGTLKNSAPAFGAGMPSVIESPRDEIIEILKALKVAGHYIVVWSGGGKDYAEMTVRQFNLNEFVDECKSKMDNDGTIDMCFDDMDAFLAKVNIKV